MAWIYSRTVVRWHHAEMAPCYVIDFTAGWSFGKPSDLIGIPARLCPELTEYIWGHLKRR